MVETEQLTQAGWTFLVVVAAFAAGALILTLFMPSPAGISNWAHRYGVPVTDANRSVFAAYLRRTRGLQIAGAAAGWVASPLYSAITGRPFPLGDNWVALAVVGFLTGAVIAEVASGNALEPASDCAPRR